MRRAIMAVLALALALSALSCAAQKAVKPEPQMAVPETFKLPPVLPKPKSAQAATQTSRVEPIRITQEKEEKYIVLNFDNTDIKTIIASFGELLNINYVVSPGVTGNITIQSYKKIPVSELFPVFQSILELNGLTAIKDGPFYKIVPIDSAKTQSVGVEGGKELKLELDSTFVTQLVPLEHIKAKDTEATLAGFLPRGANIVVYEPTNMLIITALPPTIARLMKIIEAIDVADIATESPRTYVYDVVNGEAKKLADVLKSVLTSEKGAEKPSTSPVSALRPPSTFPARTPAARMPITPAATQAQITSVNAEGISITAYEDINALIIKCSPKDYVALLDLLRQLDLPPKQVLMEVMIAELTLSDELNFGLEWLVKNSHGNQFGSPGATFGTPGSVGISSFTGFSSLVSGVIDDAAFQSILSFVEGSSKFNIVASPLILAVDNKDAEITIGSSVPVATGLNQTQSLDTTVANPTLVSSGQIDYRDIGTILKITPHITEKGNVSLSIYVESSSVADSPTKISGNDFTAFNKRDAKTNAVVGDGHTLFIGGIIDNQVNQSNSGIPFLSRIPIIGHLLMNHEHIKKDKTELLIMITPHVIRDQESADDLTERYKNKIRVVEKAFLTGGDDKVLRQSDAEERAEHNQTIKSEEAAEPATPAAAQPAAK